ncbi:hypothetical protein ACTJKY_21710, partial [Sphingomonas sp. 22176]
SVRGISVWMKISAFNWTAVDPVSRLKSTPSRHRFEKPIHNVKKLASPWGSQDRCRSSGSRVFISGYNG